MKTTSLIKLFLMLCTLCGTLFSCGESKENAIFVDLDNVEEIKLADIVDSVKIVQLETTPECLIPAITKTFYYTSYIEKCGREHYNYDPLMQRTKPLLMPTQMI